MRNMLSWWREKQLPSSSLCSCLVIMTKWKPCRKALTVGVNVLSDPWAGAPRSRTPTAWKPSPPDPTASAHASLLGRRSSPARERSGWTSSGRLEKKMSRWIDLGHPRHGSTLCDPNHLTCRDQFVLMGWLIWLLQLSTILELLEGSFYGMDLLKLHSLTSKLLKRVDRIEKVYQQPAVAQRTDSFGFLSVKITSATSFLVKL